MDLDNSFDRHGLVGCRDQALDRGRFHAILPARREELFGNKTGARSGINNCDHWMHLRRLHADGRTNLIVGRSEERDDFVVGGLKRRFFRVPRRSGSSVSGNRRNANIRDLAEGLLACVSRVDMTCQ